jgi:predicted RNA binding protein YcfA (HicA-like mRNA interferase family)
MTRLPVVSGRDVARVLARMGFRCVGQRGSHTRWKGHRLGRPKVVIVPMHAEIAPGTLRSILRQAGMSGGEFLDHLR